ncbi:MAG: hypothetical protein Q7S74_01860 [Nanoarchaeota archaeon]|nr:hypothetical protein [Nanoarchaeota archaeon]
MAQIKTIHNTEDLRRLGRADVINLNGHHYALRQTLIERNIFEFVRPFNAQSVAVTSFHHSSAYITDKGELTTRGRSLRAYNNQNPAHRDDYNNSAQILTEAGLGWQR